MLACAKHHMVVCNRFENAAVSFALLLFPYFEQQGNFGVSIRTFYIFYIKADIQLEGNISWLGTKGIISSHDDEIVL